jgi:tripartite-type tricarboxylate transporter receptor subunit TctC
MKKRELLAAGFALAATAAMLPLNALAQADAWPQQKPVTIIVPFPAGGSTDMVARALALQLQTKLGGSFVVDNRPGATGTIGTGFVKRAAPDGYTLLVSSLGAFVVTPHLHQGRALRRD